MPASCLAVHQLMKNMMEKQIFYPVPRRAIADLIWNGKILSKEKQKRMAGTILSMMCNLQDSQIPGLTAERDWDVRQNGGRDMGWKADERARSCDV
jgi:hypothetical protein